MLDLVLEDPVLLQKFVLDSFVVIELDRVLLTQCLVLILLILHPH